MHIYQQINEITSRIKQNSFPAEQLMYYEFKMVDPALRKIHTEANQGEIFKVE